MTKIEEILKFTFKNPQLFEEALTHRSFHNDNKKGANINNERIEFLGDAVLELIVTEFLFKNFTKYREGDLTSFRAALVKTESLAEEADRLGFGEFIKMSKGEESTGGRKRPYILANTMEAIIGATYLDQGYEVVKNFVLENICYKADQIISSRSDLDPKSRLQELSQEKLKITPIYSEVSATGPDHNKVFEMAVTIGEYQFSIGEGKSKQEAEQSAAQKALENWESLLKQYFKL